MKKILGIFISLSTLSFAFAKVAPSLTPKVLWTVAADLKNPESVVYDATSSTYYVSNIDGDGVAKDGNGYITQVSVSGKVKKAKWVTGLNAPKGLALRGTSLWVSDINELIEIDTKSGKTLQKIKIEGAKFLNDVATTADFVFVSDTLGNQIYKYDGKTVTPLSSKETFESPNGLLVVDNKLLVASWGEVTDFSQTPKQAGRLYSISFDGKDKSLISKSFGNLDGLQKVKDTYIVSDWMSGKLYTVNKKGIPTLVSQGPQGYADLDAKEENGKTVVVLPLMVENKLVAYEL